MNWFRISLIFKLWIILCQIVIFWFTKWLQYQVAKIWGFEKHVLWSLHISYILTISYIRLFLAVLFIEILSTLFYSVYLLLGTIQSMWAQLLSIISSTFSKLTLLTTLCNQSLNCSSFRWEIWIIIIFNKQFPPSTATGGWIELSY